MKIGVYRAEGPLAVVRKGIFCGIVFDGRNETRGRGEQETEKFPKL